MPQLSNQRLLPVFTGLFVACLLITNVMNSAKFLQLGILTVAGGTIVFPISFIFGDILTEVYGYAQSRKVIWTGFASLIFAAAVFFLVQHLPAPDFWQNQAAYDSIFSAAPRIIFASMTAYFCGEFCNSVVLSKMKYRSDGKRGLKQAWRFIFSTIVGEGVDSIVFFTVAFAGVLSASQLVTSIVSAYLFKVAFEVVLTPISTRFANWVKVIEKLDVIDDPKQTTYNPFAVTP
jgi:queuosine precursor transporter